MEITPASLRDLGQLRRLENTCFGKDSWPLMDLIAVLSFPDVVRLKACVENRMIGFIAGDQRQNVDTSWIATIAVQPEFRRQGIGRQLLRACEQYLPQPRLRLCVRATNAAAIELYRCEGYLPMDTWKNYYTSGEDALVMEKQRR